MKGLPFVLLVSSLVAISSATSPAAVLATITLVVAAVTAAAVN
jgi:hypothetical protein